VMDHALLKAMDVRQPTNSLTPLSQKRKDQ
jgi:hypothetical protein